jgi:hypothetical protein
MPSCLMRVDFRKKERKKPGKLYFGFAKLQFEAMMCANVAQCVRAGRAEAQWRDSGQSVVLDGCIGGAVLCECALD